ncbi:unnamed protein product, partial [Rotaria magnacalcarata]
CDHGYCIEVFTIPRIDKYLYVDDYLNKNTVYAQSRWSSTVSILNHRSVYINEICNSEMNDKYLSYLSTTISWHQIASLKIIDPLDLRQLRLLVSKMINLRTLEVYYQFNDEDDADLNKPNLLDLLNDTFLCNMLMSNEFKKLNLHTNWEYPDMIGIAS